MSKLLENALTIAKNVVNNGDALHYFGQAEFHKALQELADGQRGPKETQAQAYARVAVTDPDGIVLMKAIAIVHGKATRDLLPTVSKFEMPGVATLTPSHVGGAAARDVDDPADVLAQLNSLVDAQIAAGSKLSRAQVFAEVYAKNPRLAAAERRQNSPRATIG
jgi:hypothetical protein